MQQSKSFIFIGGAIGCLVVFLCIGLIALIWLGSAGGNPLLSQSTPVDRIAYMDNEPNIQIVDARGENRIALTTDATADNDIAYRYPTWSPDSRSVAFVRVSGDNRQFEGGVYAAPVAGGELATVSKSNAQIPIYLYWSPDSQHIGFLAQSNQELSLMVGHPAGKEDAKKLETGSPLYWAWSPDSRTLLTHIGGTRRDSRTARIGLLQWQSANAPQTIAPSPAAFQAPQFSPDGTAILYAGVGESDQDALYVADARGDNSRLIANFNGRIAFAWSPNGKKIAWLETPPLANLTHFGTLNVSDADGQNSKTLGTENALAFYWSPDSQQIAYVSLPTPGSQGCEDCGKVPGLALPLDQGRGARLRWRVVNLASAQTRTLVTFAPTQNFIEILPYFDQYSRSMTFWSPDSQRFVYTQREGSQGGQSGSVWVVELADEAAPRKIGDGTFAVWSWK